MKQPGPLVADDSLQMFGSAHSERLLWEMERTTFFCWQTNWKRNPTCQPTNVMIITSQLIIDGSCCWYHIVGYDCSLVGSSATLDLHQEFLENRMCVALGGRIAAAWPSWGPGIPWRWTMTDGCGGWYLVMINGGWPCLIKVHGGQSWLIVGNFLANTRLIYGPLIVNDC